MIFAVLMLASAGILLLYNSSEDTRVEDDNLETVTQLENILEKQNDNQNNVQNSEKTENTENNAISLNKDDRYKLRNIKSESRN